MVRPDPMRNILSFGGGGGERGSRFSEKFRVGNGKLCYLLLECFVFLEVETHFYTLFNI